MIWSLAAGGQLHGELLVLQAAVQIGNHQVDDVGDVLPGQRLVEHDLVQPVEELRTEGPLEQLIDLVPGLLADLSVRPDASSRNWLPRLEVRMITVFLKSTVRP